ncbi:MAG: retropepsin-like aspartic protease [Novosphingobium sp.]
MPSLSPVFAALALAVLPPAHHASGAQEGAAATDIVTIAPDRADRMTVPVHIGDQGPFRFLIDTGSENTVLSAALAQRLALAPTARATVVGVAGHQQVDTVEIDEIALGSRRFQGLVAPLLDATDIGADGIVGLDGLQGQRVLLDFTRNTMLLSDARTDGGDTGFEIVVTARRRSGQLVMTHATIDGVRTNVVIDTGSEMSIGNRALQRALASATPLAPRLPWRA